MLFNSLTFLFFFLFVYGLFWVIPRWTGKKLLLLVASYIFYAAWSPPYIVLLLVSTSVDWWLARLIGRTENLVYRRALLVLSLITNLGLLAYFKYGDFLLSNFSALLVSFGVVYHFPESLIVLPVGISFYTFASLSYTIDVYRREVKSDWGFADYALFVSFFPHLVAGPIVRASYLLPQIATPKQPTQNQIGWGFALVLMGLFSKAVMADAIFAPVVDSFYAAPLNFGTGDAWAAVLSFSGQIYYDFSGYSLCAIGLAMSFGFAFPDNFHHPYAARSVSEFWRRWHISLSTWLRDYLYIPLGGNRGGEWNTYRNLLLTMLIGGLWHGASWMFVLWGGLHGLYLAAERTLGLYTTKHSPSFSTRQFRILPVLFTFIVVTLTWIPFRASSPSEAAIVTASLFHAASPSRVDFQDLFALIAILITVWWHIVLRDASLEEVFAKSGWIVQTCVMASCLIGLFLYSGGDQRAFIYFQF